MPETILIRGLADGVPCYIEEVFGEPKENELPPLLDRIPFMTHGQLAEWCVKRSIPFKIGSRWAEISDGVMMRKYEAENRMTVDGEKEVFDRSGFEILVEDALPPLPVPKPEYKDSFLYVPERFKDNPREGWTMYRGRGVRVDPKGQPESVEEAAKLIHCEFTFQYDNRYVGAFANFLLDLLADIVSGRMDTMQGINT